MTRHGWHPGVLTVLLGLVVVGCGSTTPKTGTETTAAQATVPATTQASSYKVGDTVDTRQDLKITLHDWKLPAQGSSTYDTPPAGSKFGAADVEACARTKATSINPFRFTVQMADNRRIEHGIGGPRPSLNHTELQPDECVRGWVTFDVPDTGTPTYLVFTPYSGPGTKWSLS